jgi:hypothetical protein
VVVAIRTKLVVAIEARVIEQLVMRKRLAVVLPVARVGLRKRRGALAGDARELRNAP